MKAFFLAAPLLLLAARAHAEDDLFDAFGTPTPAPESTAIPTGSPTPEPVTPIWSASGCAPVLTEIRDKSTGNPLPRARVLGLPRAATPEAGASTKPLSMRGSDLIPLGRTSAEGTIVVPPPGASKLVVELPGFQRAEIETPCSDAITVLTVELQPLAPEQRADASAGGDAHRLVRGDTLETMAGTPRNVFSAIETLPGVVRPVFGDSVLASIFGNGDLGVRGSRPGESRTFVDGIEIPYFYHYLALSSVIPAEMVEFVDFVPGGAGPQFGRVTGGVVDVHSRAVRGEEEDSWHGRANLELWEGNAIVRGPVGGGTLSISDRSSFWDFIARARGSGWGPNAPIWGYDDYQAIYKLPLGYGRELDVLALGSWDDISFDGNPTQVHTEFHRAGFAYRKRTESSHWQVAANVGEDRFVTRLFEPGQGIRLGTSRTSRELRLASDGEVKLKDVLPLRGGAELHFVEPEAGLSLDWEQQEWAIIDRSFTDKQIWGGVWTEAEVRPVPRVVIIPGVRVDYDTLVKEAWVDPRLTVRWFVGEHTAISAAGGEYHKPQPFAVAFADQKKLGLTDAQQASAGVNHVFGHGFDTDLRVFYGTFRDQVQGIEWLPTFDRSILGNGVSYGVESFSHFASSNGKNRGSLGVTVSQTRWNNVSTYGNWTASDLDSTVGITALLDHQMRHNWLFGMRARWYTGFPYTTYDADVYVPDDSSYVGVGENPFAGRAPPFFQVDVRFTKHWILSSGMGMEAFLDIQNLTNRANVDRVAGGTGKPTDPPTSPSLPIFPSLGFSVTF